MAGLGNKFKLTVLKGMEAIGQSASNLASNAQQKLQELNLETQRREILSDFPLRAYDLWQKGETMPEPLDKMMKELSELDERLGVLRAQRYAKVEGAEGGEAADDGADNSGEQDDGAASNGGEGDGGEAVCAEAPGEAMLEGHSNEAAPADESSHISADAPLDDGETGDNA